MDGFAKHLQRHMDSVLARWAVSRTLSAQDQSAQQVKYSGERMDWATPWVGQFAKTVKEGWEYGAVQTSLEDYGQAQWHSRTIEAISVRVTFSRINRVIGEKDATCYVFAWIDDQEFSFVRQAMVNPCGDYAAAFTPWKQANAFTSQWTLLPVTQQPVSEESLAREQCFPPRPILSKALR